MIHLDSSFVTSPIRGNNKITVFCGPTLNEFIILQPGFTRFGDQFLLSRRLFTLKNITLLKFVERIFVTFHHMFFLYYLSSHSSWRKTSHKEKLFNYFVRDCILFIKTFFLFYKMKQHKSELLIWIIYENGN